VVLLLSPPNPNPTPSASATTLIAGLRTIGSTTAPTDTPIPHPTTAIPTATVIATATRTAVTPSRIPPSLPTPTPTITASATEESIETLVANFAKATQAAIALSWTPTQSNQQQAATFFAQTLTATYWTQTPTPTITPIPAGATLTDPTDGTLTLVWVPPGAFTMGSTDQQVQDALANAKKIDGTITLDKYAVEKPAHTVTITNGFWLDQNLVTNAAFQKFADAGGYTNDAYWSADGLAWRKANKITAPYKNADCSVISSQPDQPRVCVSYFEAEAYAKWRGGRLPTEAEWEFAARGPQSLIYPWGNTFDGKRLNSCDSNCSNQPDNDGYPYTSPVGTYPSGKSWTGAYDMAGNAWQWVSDWFGATYYQNPPAADPTGPSSGQWRVIRGGAWNSYLDTARSAYRLYNLPDNRSTKIGFRVVLDRRS
jgi:formylglycine-generating enzyme required for sulfatase activity